MGDDDGGGGTLVATPRIWRERAEQAREAKKPRRRPCVQMKPNTHGRAVWEGRGQTRQRSGADDNERLAALAV